MKTEAEVKRDRDEDLRTVMSTVNGRRFMWRLLVQAGLQSSSFVAGDSLATSFNEGRRHVAIALRDELERVDVALYAAMLREALDTAELQRIESAKAAVKEP